jgi:hypothetical protein
MQIPIPPVSQCKKRQTANPDQENQAGFKASTAPACRAPIQITGAHEISKEAAREFVVVVMINL